MAFAIPRGGSTYFGTTDTFYSDNMEQPAVTRKDVTYLLNAMKDEISHSPSGLITIAGGKLTGFRYRFG